MRITSKTALLGIALSFFAVKTACQAQPLLGDNDIQDGPPANVLPQNAILHAQFNNPYRVIENIERFIVATVPEKLLPPDMRQLAEMEHPVLTVLGMQTVQAPLTLDKIGEVTGLGADRPITLTAYLGEPAKSFIVSIPVDNFERFEGFLRQALGPDSIESASVGGKSFVRAKLRHPVLRQVVMAGSSDRIFISGSESLLMLLYSGASDAHLSDDPQMAKVSAATSKSDLWLTFNPSLLKPLMPQLEFFKYVPLNMVVSKRAEFLKNIPDQQRQMIEQRLRLQLGVQSLEELADYAECFISATYEEIFDLVVNGLKSFNGISVALKLDSEYPQLSYFLHSDSLQAETATQPIPLGEVREALSRIPGVHNHISITGQAPEIAPSARFTSWLGRLKAGIEAKQLNPAFVLALEKVHLNTLHPQKISSRVPWTLETRTVVAPRPSMGDFESLKDYSQAMTEFVGAPASRNVTVTPRRDRDLLERSLRERIDAFEKNNRLVKETLFPEQRQISLIEKVYRLNTRKLDRGVNEQTWETAFVSRGGLFGFNQHEFISRKQFYSRNVGDYYMFHQASRDAAWISNLELLDTPQSNRGLAAMLDRVPQGANRVGVHRFLTHIPQVVQGLADFEALLRRDTDGYLRQARAIAAGVTDPEELSKKLEGLKFSQIVYSINRDTETGDLYCLLPGGITYPRPAIAHHVVKLFENFSNEVDSLGGILCYTRVADGTLEGSIIQNSGAISKLIQTVGNSIYDQILGDPERMSELKDQIWIQKDRDSNRFNEIIAKNPALEFIPMPGQGFGHVAAWEKTDAKPTVPVAERDASAPANLINLSDYFNASVNESWHAGGMEGNDLSAIPQGIQELDGIQFDIRGIVQLTGRGAEEQLSVRFPSEVSNIPIDKECEQLHLLHAAGWTDSDGTKVACLRLHYADGESREIPVLYGQHVRDWWTPPNGPGASDSTVVWKGQNQASSGSEMSLQLYKTTWPNPRPGKAIQSIDYVSCHSNAAPFLLAMTLE